MIRVRYEVTDEGHTLSLQGHAGRADEGEDIVCAAVSVLFMTLCEVTEGENVSSGDYNYYEITCERSETNDAAMSFALCGLGILAEENPENIFIEE